MSYRHSVSGVLICLSVFYAHGPAAAQDVRRVSAGELLIQLDAGFPADWVLSALSDGLNGGSMHVETVGATRAGDESESLSFLLSPDSFVRVGRDEVGAFAESVHLRAEGAVIDHEEIGAHSIGAFLLSIDGWDDAPIAANGAPRRAREEADHRTGPGAKLDGDRSQNLNAPFILYAADVRLEAQGNVLFIVSDDVRMSPSWAAAVGRPQLAGARIGTAVVRALLETDDETEISETTEASEPSGQAAGTIGPDIIVGDLPFIGNFGCITRAGECLGDSTCEKNPLETCDSDADCPPVCAVDISAFSVATTSCNLGDESAKWIAGTNEHPVIAQNMYRLKDNRFEQIGMSWVKHGFAVVAGRVCETEDLECECLNTNSCSGQALSVGCSDPYGANLNGTWSLLGPRSQINALTGFFSSAWKNEVPNQPCTTPPCATIDRRLQVRNADLDPLLNLESTYFVEGHYVTADDAQAGNGQNNASYRQAELRLSCAPSLGSDAFCMKIADDTSTQREKPAIHAWRDQDPSVEIRDVKVPGEGLLILGAKAVNLGTGVWRYVYALQNINSHRGARSLSIPLPVGAEVTNIGFHDVDHHSGDMWGVTPCGRCSGDPDRICAVDDHCIWNGPCLPEGTCANDPKEDCTDDRDCPLEIDTCGIIDESLCEPLGKECLADRAVCDNDWDVTVVPGAPGLIRWGTLEHVPNENNDHVNALRWGTLYTFWFDVNATPESTTATIGLFIPDATMELSPSTIGPALGVQDCDKSGVPDVCKLSCEEPACAELELQPCSETGGEMPCCGGSTDCNANGAPDECEPDCRDNGIPNQCDILISDGGFCEPGVRDDCSADCNDNVLPDECDIRDCPPGEEWCEDCNENTVPDGCEELPDSDADGLVDCNDRCPFTTPPGACECPPMERCCCNEFCFCVSIQDCMQLTREQCLANEGCLPSPDCNERPVCRGGCIIGDMTGDGAVHLRDAAGFARCFSGPKEAAGFAAPSDDCLFWFDFDENGAVDYLDHEAFHRILTGPR